MDNTINTFIGIDVAKRSLDLAFEPTHFSQTFSNDLFGISQLLKSLPQQATCRITIEATGGYERSLVAELLNADYHVAVVNPRQVRNFAKAFGINAKTDRIDAAVIARFGQHVNPRIAQKPNEQQEELQQLVTRRRQLVELRTAEKNRLETLTSKHVQQSVNDIVVILDQQIKTIEKQITHLTQSNELFKDKGEILASVPGVGAITVATLLAELPELGLLNRQEIGALAGLAPFNRDSGRFQGKRSIWGGRAAIRSVLYMAALTAKQHNPVIQKFAKQLEQTGKPFKVIITACMRKLLVILNTLLKNNSHWKPNYSAANT